MADRLTTQNAIQKLAAVQGKEFLDLFHYGSLEIEIYKPNKVDHQHPHPQDELYVVIAGSGYFVNGRVRTPFEPGEVLLVPAGVEHRFEEFTDDFSTWVFLL